MTMYPLLASERTGAADGEGTGSVGSTTPDADGVADV